MQAFIVVYSIFSIFVNSNASALDTFVATQSIRDGKTIVSSGGNFELGFCSPGNSKSRYVGIWYKKFSPRTVVWFANRDMPLKHTSSALKLADQGTLVLLDEANNTIWSSNSSRSATNPVSFDHPSDTLIPGMKYGNNSVTFLNHLLTSWKSTDDPLRGDYTVQLDPNNGLPQYLMWKAFQLDRSQSWSLYSTVPVDECETYAFCGAFSSCNINNSPLCGCLRGFVTKSPQDWNAIDWSNRCVRKTPLDCGDGDGFLKYSGFKLPDTWMLWHNRTMDLKECNNVCLKNCSCTGYATLDIRGGGSGCILWFGELIDIRA
ncbi:hypothetical protein ACB092_06G095000 [Castanea dentata]